MNLVDRLLAGGQRSAAVVRAALWAWAWRCWFSRSSCRSRCTRWDPHILTSGVTIYNDRYEALPSDSLRVEEMKRDDVLFYREGLTTTVSVHRIPGSDYIYFKSNGKIDGSYGDALSQLMTSYIAMMLHPKAETALTIGLGSGMSAKALATFKSLKEIEVIEIEPAMIEASKFFDRAVGASRQTARGRELSRRRSQEPGLVQRRRKSVSIIKA